MFEDDFGAIARHSSAEHCSLSLPLPFSPFMRRALCLSTRTLRTSTLGTSTCASGTTGTGPYAASRAPRWTWWSDRPRTTTGRSSKKEQKETQRDLLRVLLHFGYGANDSEACYINSHDCNLQRPLLAAVFCNDFAGPVKTLVFHWRGSGAAEQVQGAALFRLQNCKTTTSSGEIILHGLLKASPR